MNSILIPRAPTRASGYLLSGVALGVSLALGGSASAFELSTNSPDLSIRLDSTLSYGARSRLDDPDERLIGLSNGGKAFSVNGDDGNLNYKEGIVSNTVKLTSELLFDAGDGGAFIRGTAFYDQENEDGDRKRTELTDEALDLVGSDAKIQDAYVWQNFDIGSNRAELRIGNQVINWGESTFIQGGINSFNAVDVSKLRVPGAELREAFEAAPYLSLSADTSDNTALEMFYQTKWKKTEIDPPGSYFSTNDFAGAGGNKVLLGFGSVPDATSVGAPVGTPAGVAVPRDPNRVADDDGQFGFAYRIFTDRAEYGLYAVNFHSRLPLISARTGTVAGAGANNYTASAGYIIEYPEDIQLFGLSLNTSLGASGWALQGEISVKKDAPLQIDDVEILLAALSPLGGGAAPNNQITNGGALGFDEYFAGYIERDVWQSQATLTKVFGNVMGANQFALVTEAAFTYVDDFPDTSELRLDAPGTYTSGNPAQAAAGGAHAGKAAESASNFADKFSWGYRVAGRWTYNNALGPWNVLPRFSFQHDVEGNSPGPGGNFLEDRLALTLGVGFAYKSEWELDLSYTDFNGAGRHNLINDRDFVAFNAKYSF